MGSPNNFNASRQIQLTQQAKQEEEEEALRKKYPGLAYNNLIQGLIVK